MPMFPGLSRPQGQSGDLDVRRHSFYSTESRSNPTIASGRVSEQIPRKPSAAEFLSPDDALRVPATNIPEVDVEDEDGNTAQRSVSPPVQEKTPKHHRFSMLKFRHASDSQLSTRAKLQSHHPPPMPTRESPPPPNRELQQRKLYSPNLHITLHADPTI